MERDYYKRYWAGELKGKLANYPPEWNPKDARAALFRRGC